MIRASTARGLMLALSLAAMCLGDPAAAFAAAADTAEPTQVLLHLLDYIAVDYPEFAKEGVVLDQAEYDEQVEFATRARRLRADRGLARHARP